MTDSVHEQGDPTGVARPTPLHPGSGPGCALVSRFVDALNARDPDALLDLVSPGFTDHDPLVLPGVVEGSYGRAQGAAYWLAVIEFLSRDGVALEFALEDLFEHGETTAYRLEGTGSVEVIQAVPTESPEGTEVAVPADPAPASTLPSVFGDDRRPQVADQPPLPAPVLLKQTLPITYRCVGMFRVDHQKFVERWGMASLR